MPLTNDPKRTSATTASDSGVLVDIPGVVGVDPSDPTGALPSDAKERGIEVIVPRWPDFPAGVQAHTVDIYIVGITDSVAQRTYGAADSAPEFFILVPPASLPNTASFEVFYIVRTPNPTTSPSRRLTFTLAPPPLVLREPIFPDASLWGYIHCHKSNSDPEALYIWEGVRIFIPFDDRFQPLDIIELRWQGWDSLNGSGAALTPLTRFSGTVTAADVRDKNNILIVVRPFIPHIEPMTNNDSALATYTLVRNGIPMFRSRTGLVKIDRVIPGEKEFCSDASWMK